MSLRECTCGCLRLRTAEGAAEKRERRRKVAALGATAADEIVKAFHRRVNRSMYKFRSVRSGSKTGIIFLANE